MVKIAVCDDDPLFLEQASSALQDWAGSNQLDLQLYTFSDGDALIASHSRNHMDLILLDVVMPLMNGMDIAHKLRQTDTHVGLIFLTSSPEYALESYEVRAFWYLLKPVQKEQLFRALDSWRDTLFASSNTFTARTTDGYRNLYLQDIESLEAQNKLVVVTLQDHTILNIKEPFHKCEEIFTLQRGFFKCHRSYIVAFKSVEKFSKSEIITRSGCRIPISRDIYSVFKDAYFSYMFPEK